MGRSGKVSIGKECLGKGRPTKYNLLMHFFQLLSTQVFWFIYLRIIRKKKYQKKSTRLIQAGLQGRDNLRAHCPLCIRLAWLFRSSECFYPSHLALFDMPFFNRSACNTGYGMVFYGIVWYGSMLWCGMVCYGMVWVLTIDGRSLQMGAKHCFWGPCTEGFPKI